MNNLEQMRDALRNRLGVAEADNFYTAPVCDDLINEAIQANSIEEEWPWQLASATLTTVAGTQSYTPAVTAGHTWLRTRAITTPNSDSLLLRSLIEVRECGTDGGEPAIYCITNEQLVFAPIPSRVIAYTHDYIRQEPILVFNTDTPLMPIPFRFGVIHLAAALAQLRQGDTSRHQMENQAYRGWLDRMRDNKNRSAATKRTRVRPGSWL